MNENLGVHRVNGHARASSRLRQGCVKVGLGGGEIRNLDEGGWAGWGGGRGHGECAPPELAITICLDMHLGRRRELGTFCSLPAAVTARARTSAPLAWSPPHPLCGRCLPADASWSPPLHGCHRLLVCY